jgi:hypothetical protein
MRHSHKISLKGSNSDRGLEPFKIAEGRRYLASGELCKALTVFEDKNETFSLALHKVFGISERRAGALLATAWLAKAADERPWVNDVMNGILADPKFLTDLIASEMMSGLNPSLAVDPRFRPVLATVVKMFFSTALVDPSFLIPANAPAEQVPLRLALIVRLFNSSGIFKLEGKTDTVANLKEAINKASYQMLEQWAAAHPEEVAFVRDWTKAVEGKTLAGMTEQKEVP